MWLKATMLSYVVIVWLAQGTQVSKDTFIKAAHSKGLEVTSQETRAKIRPFFGYAYFFPAHKVNTIVNESNI